MRRRLAITCLILAWLCANGAVWNVVQMVGWAMMFHDNAQKLPAAEALRVTFDGSKPCALCHLSQSAQKTAREQLPPDAVPNGADKLLLAYQPLAPLLLGVPRLAWPVAVNDAGPTRTEVVPVPPPRA